MIGFVQPWKMMDITYKMLLTTFTHILHKNNLFYTISYDFHDNKLVNFMIHLKRLSKTDNWEEL